MYVQRLSAIPAPAPDMTQKQDTLFQLCKSRVILELMFTDFNVHIQYCHGVGDGVVLQQTRSKLKPNIIHPLLYKYYPPIMVQ